MVSKDQLSADERVVLQLRTHAKSLILPALALIVFTAGLGVGIAVIPESWNPVALWVLVAGYVIVLWWVVLLPFLRWLTSTYTITDRRIITRRGILNKSGHDVPLRRINNVNYDKSVVDRVLGCGTLVLETAAGQPLVLPDVPSVERVQVTINDLLFGDGGPTLEDGSPAHLDD